MTWTWSNSLQTAPSDSEKNESRGAHVANKLNNVNVRFLRSYIEKDGHVEVYRQSQRTTVGVWNDKKKYYYPFPNNSEAL